ncbi:MAG: alpha/beta hydrolase fold domain-containing protein [Hyphomicrobiales bacterium]|nr:alpha/beta hydrolase fold domain-containing protein [Hyphomicrobiales bacterium]
MKQTATSRLSTHGCSALHLSPLAGRGRPRSGRVGGTLHWRHATELPLTPTLSPQATREAILMAGYGRMKVVSIDYHMPPDAPYPAAMDDAMAVWREVVKSNDPKKLAIFGTSTGGGMTLAMVLRAKTEGLPLPAATAPGTPWSDMTKTGDSFFTNEMVDNVIVPRTRSSQNLAARSSANFGFKAAL